MNYAIFNGVLEVGGVEVKLPGLPIQVVKHSTNLFVLVDETSTDNNVYKVNCDGEIVWQIKSGSRTANSYRKLLASGEHILLFTKENTICIVDDHKGLSMPLIPPTIKKSFVECAEAIG